MLVTVAERVIYGLWVPPSVAALPSDVAPQRPGGGVASVATVETPRSAVVRELSGSTAAAQGGGSAAPSAAQDGGAEASPAVAGCLAVGASSEVARVRPLYLRADAHLGSERTVLATPVLGTPLDELQSRVVPGRRPQLAPALKLALHISLVIALHASFCIGLARGGASALPVWACNKDYCDGTEAPAGQPICTRSRAGLGFYLLCCLYLLLSALQLKHGMPLIPTEHPLTGSAGLSRYYLHLAAMSFPFLWEMRTSLDWTVARTSLSLFEWLKLEDIYAGLVSVRATMAFKLRSPRGAQRTVETKLGTGALFVAAVLLLILGPMFVFSSANPISEANLVRSAQVRLTLRTPTGLFPLGATTRFNNDIELPLPLTSPVLSADCSGDKLQDRKSEKDCGYAYLLPLDANVDYQRVSFAEASDLVWGINPTALAELKAAVESSSAGVSLEAAVEWTRRLPVGGTTSVSLSRSVVLNSKQRREMAVALNASEPGARGRAVDARGLKAGGRLTALR
uniref:Piezo THU9 and anchor domain-containing protein n=2 Tax=Emiliania huxleyi TaxID=2903 RepID=A0A7S3WFA5_EMIHU